MSLSAANATDPNVWYTLQSFGSDYYLGCAFEGTAGGNITSEVNGTIDASLWQISYTSTDNLDTFWSCKSLGPSYCLKVDQCSITNSGAPSCVPNLSIGPCDSGSLTWVLGLANGNSTSDGFYITTSRYGSDYRVYSPPQSNSNAVSSFNEYILEDYTGLSASNRSYMAWAVVSAAAINDENWSSIPPGIFATTATALSSASATYTFSSLSSGSSGTSLVSRTSTAVSQVTVTITSSGTSSSARTSNPTTTGGGQTQSSLAATTTASTNSNSNGVAGSKINTRGLLKTLTVSGLLLTALML